MKLRGSADGLWRSRTILQQLAVPFTLVMGTVALVLSVYVPSREEGRALAALEARAQSIAAVTAANLAAAVVFEDEADMRRTIRRAFEAPEVIFARLSKPDDETLIEVIAPSLQRHDDMGGKGRPFSSAVVPVRTEVGDTLAWFALYLTQHEVAAQVAATRSTIQLVSAVIFVFGVFVLLLVSRILVAPLFGIVEAAERIADGERRVRAPVVKSDEVGRLALAFNTMVDQLQSSQEGLEALNADLERRVEERTRHLEEEHAQRIEAEEESARLVRFYGQILDTLPLQIAVLDMGRRLVYLNPASVPDPEDRARLMGLTLAEAGFAAYSGQELHRRREEAIDKVMGTGCLVSMEESYARPGEERRHYIRVVSPMLGADGDVAQIVSYGVDVTSRKEAEEALRESEEKLRQSQKMEAVGRLAGGIAHDFNNLLTVIAGHAELLMMDLDPGGQDFQEMEQIKGAADQATTLTRQLLAFSRRQVMQPVLLDPNQVVAGVERMLGRLIGEHIHLVTDLRSGLGEVEADPGQLEQVLMNLAVNAKDAMPRGGRLTIETEALTAESARARWGYEVTAGRYILISVRDTGVGIEAEHLERIFEPFFTTKEVGEGTGLGLSTVYGIVKQTGGYVYVDSDPGIGTVFRVFLPVADAPGIAADERGLGLTMQLARGAETVLLVEDDEMVRSLTERVLKRAGYRVLAANGAHEALGIVKNHAGPIHLLLTDVVMPGLQGNELAARVVELRPSIKVLYMSGYTDRALLNQGALQDGVVLLQKPFTAERATQVVRATLDGRTPERTSLVAGMLSG